MTKLELIKALKDENGLSEKEVAAVIDLFFDEMTDALSKGNRIEIRKFCSYYIKNHKAYTGRNPKTGDRVAIAPKKMPFFKCGKELKERVDYKG